MALDHDIRVLSGVGLFSELSAEQLRLLAFGAESVRLSAGQQIYAQDAPADCAFVVVSGTIALERDDDARPTRLGPGTLLGELALIADTTRPSNAVAVTDVVLLRLSRTLFRRILEEYPDTAVELHRRLTEDLRVFLERIERLAPRFDR